MAAVYVTIDEIQTLGRKLTADEQIKAEALIPIAAAQLRVAVAEYGFDLDSMIEANEDIAQIAKVISVRAILRAVDNDSGSAVTQESQSAMGYSLSMSYLNAGQDLYFLKNELKELGIMEQRIGAFDIYGGRICKE